MAENSPFIPLVTSRASTSNANNSRNMTVYLDSAPYPTVDETKPDPETVAMLKEDRSGAVSEMTGIMQYLFQNNRLGDGDPFANAMLQIAIVEMIHLDMLGDAIQALGGKPSFDDGKYYWQAGLVNYADTLPAMLQADIEAETGAIANYQKHAAQTKNPQVRALLERIIKDEQLHLRFFNDTLATIQSSQ